MSNSSDKPDQIINNQAPNQGAQGTFHGPVNIHHLQSTPKLTPRSALALFISFFIVFTAIGYLHGDSVVKDEKYLSLVIGKKLSIQRDNQEIVFLYQCSPNLAITYHIDSDSIQDASFLNNPYPDYRLIESIIPIIKDQRLVDAVILGASAWTIKDMFQYISGAKNIRGSQSRISKTASAIISAISGYSIGYYIAINRQPACDSPELKNLLKDHTLWLEWKKWTLATNYQNTVKLKNHITTCTSIILLYPNIQQSQIKQIQTTLDTVREDLEQIETRVSNGSYNIKTRDFDELQQINDKLEKSLSISLEKPLSISKELRDFCPQN